MADSCSIQDIMYKTLVSVVNIIHIRKSNATFMSFVFWSICQYIQLVRI